MRDIDIDIDPLRAGVGVVQRKIRGAQARAADWREVIGGICKMSSMTYVSNFMQIYCLDTRGQISIHGIILSKLCLSVKTKRFLLTQFQILIKVNIGLISSL